MQWDLGIDMGESGIRLATRQKGVALCSPSWGAIRADEVIAIGDGALEMLGRNPRNVAVEKPISSGSVDNPRLAALWIGRLVSPFISTGRLNRPGVLMNDTGFFNRSEKELLGAAVLEAGAQAVGWVQAEILSALGAGLDIMQPKGQMIVNVGAGVLSAGVISYGRMVHVERLPWGSMRIDRDIIHNLRAKAALSVGLRTAEDIKLGIGSALTTGDMKMKTVGMNLSTGFPAEQEISSELIRPAIEPFLTALSTLILRCAEQVSEELSADLIDEGMTLTGGGALLSGLESELQTRCGIPCRTASNPDMALIQGMAHVLTHPELGVIH